MGERVPYAWMIVLVVLCLTIGWLLRGVVENKVVEKTLQGAMAWGYDEKENVWNRIRVDNRGYVICNTKE